MYEKSMTARKHTNHQMSSNQALEPAAVVCQRRVLSLLTAALMAVPAMGAAAWGEDKPAAAETAVSAAAEWEAGLDAVMAAFMEPRKVPGGSLAVAKNGRLVFAKGYGWADPGTQEPVTPATRFRIASISKPLTALAILKLVEAGKLSLDAPMLDFFPGPYLLEEGKEPDPRLKQIRVRHLLQHTGGWDRAASGDPMFKSAFIAEKTGTAAPADTAAIIRYVLGQPLDFAPGERYAYSNFGYCLLGRIIEQRSGLPYAEYVQQAVLQPCGAQNLALGASQEAARAGGEPRYCMPEGDNEPTRSVFPGQAEKVPWPYGGFCLEAMDSHGGWIASAPDLLRVTAALAEGAERPLLGAKIRALLFEPPAPPVSRNDDGTLKDSFYTCGWMVRNQDGKFLRYSHNGSLPGTWTILTQRADGYSWAVLFNQRSSGQKLDDFDIDRAVNRWLDEAKSCPEVDLFPKQEHGVVTPRKEAAERR